MEKIPYTKTWLYCPVFKGGISNIRKSGLRSKTVFYDTPQKAIEAGSKLKATANQRKGGLTILAVREVDIDSLLMYKRCLPVRFNSEGEFKTKVPIPMGYLFLWHPVEKGITNYLLETPVVGREFKVAYGESVKPTVEQVKKPVGQVKKPTQRVKNSEEAVKSTKKKFNSSVSLVQLKENLVRSVPRQSKYSMLAYWR